MVKRISVLLFMAAAMFAQVSEGINPTSSAGASVGRNRVITEGGTYNPLSSTGAIGTNGTNDTRLPGLHNKVVTEARHPKVGCEKTELCGTVFMHSETENLVVNAGLNWLADIMSNTSTPSVNTQCNYIGLSNGSGTPAAGDTALVTTVGAEITTNGLGRAQATYAHTSNATTYTLTKTFTATGAQSAQAGAVFTAVSAGTMCFEDTFTSATLASADTLSVTWTVTI